MPRSGGGPRCARRRGGTALHWPISADSAVVRALLEAGADVGARDESGRTPLHFAAIRDPEVVALLVEGGADVNAADIWGRTPLEEAAGSGNPAIVAILLEAGAEANLPDGRRTTPLHGAARGGNLDVAVGVDDPARVCTFMRLGADPAARGGAVNPFDPAACESWGTRTFFAFATADVVADCLKAGKDVRAVFNSSPCASALLEAGADVTPPWGVETPLHIAAKSNSNPAVLNLLVEAGADVNARDY